MSSTREKLMKLLCTVSCESELEGELGSCPYRKGGKCAKVERLDYCAMQKLADHLLANGVTVQKWIPVSERLPDADSNYIVVACDEGCPYGEGIWYDTVVVVAEYYHGSWTWCENGTEYDLNGLVTHWMPLPKAPKEEA